jgi:UPF0755 protein
MKKRSLQFKAGVILTVSILTITFTFYAYQLFFTPNFMVKDGSAKEAYLYIPTGADFKTVVDSLEKNKIVHDNLSFSFVSKLLKYQENVKAGRYKIKAGSNNLDVIRKLKSGNQDPLNVTFNSVRTKEDLAVKLSAKLQPRSVELLKLLNDQIFAQKFNLDTNTIISLFIPNTYQFYWTVSAEEIFEKMHRENKKFWNEERLAKAKALGLSKEQVMIVASIVEAETNMNDEKPTIAGVYLNRFQQGWPLQADPTVKFALRDFAIKRILHVHQECDSPYNTYKYSGLPPGPINIPSISSIDAVLNCEKHDYMFFVADFTRPGYHKFTSDYRQHVNSANKYRRTLDKRQIF